MLTIRVTGVNELLSKFNNIPPKLETNLNIGIQKAIMDIQMETRPITPLDTGRLRASIGGGTYKGGSYSEGSGTKFSNLYGEIGSNVEYAYLVHEKNIRHVHGDWKFLERGAALAQPGIMRDFKLLIKQAIE